MTVTVQDRVLAAPDAGLDPDLVALYQLLKVDRYVATFTMPDTNTHDVLLIMRSIGKDQEVEPDTLLNTLPWRKKVVGGSPWHPDVGAEFMAQRKDSVHVQISGKVGMGYVRSITLPWPNHGYELADGIGSYGLPVELEIGKPHPIMVLTQPYPDPPAPAEPVLYRYCFGSAVPPEKWPEVHGVPHLYLFELTVLP